MTSTTTPARDASPPSTPGTPSSRAPAASAAMVEGSAWEIIKARLSEQGAQLGTTVAQLNARRIEVFGTSQLAVLANERVRTENNCVPRDIQQVALHDGAVLLFGYNVFLGLKKETRVEDVFAVHRFEQGDDGNWNLDAIAIASDDPRTAFLRDARFLKDFGDIYRYFKDATLRQLRLVDGGRLLAVFQVGPAARDLRVLRWTISPRGAIEYVDARGDEDNRYPSPFGFEWTRTTREQHVSGRHPHVNIEDTLFVETIGGDLTIKVENNTTTGQGIYSEPVEDKNQSLDDAHISYARVGALVLLRIVPFRETAPRHLVFNTRTKDVVRLDAIGTSCVALPEDHGIIFPGGSALATGEVKTFDVEGAEGSVFERAVRASNGEDMLYVFFEPSTGRRLLLPYNLIDKEVRTPIVCHGWSLFDDGRLIAFRAASDEASRVHPMRIWQTPFASAEHAARAQQTSAHRDSLWVKVGNPEAVRAISDVQTIRRMIDAQRPSMQMYEDLIATVQRALDAFPWFAHAEAGHLHTALQHVKATAELVVDEFEKVQAIQKAAADALRTAETQQRDLLRDVRPDSFSTIDPFLALMTRLRAQRGHLLTLKEQRYIDVARLDVLAGECGAVFDELTRRAGLFLREPTALAPVQAQHDDVMKRAGEAKQAHELAVLREELSQATAGLQLLTEVTGQLKIDDAQVRTTILEGIAAMLAQLNRSRALLAQQQQKMQASEGASEFAAQVKLLSSAVESALSLCDTPERTDAELSRLLVQVEELEGRFAGFDDFLVQLTGKRDEIFEALTARKQQLLDDKNRRAQAMMAAAERIVDGVRRRALAMKTPEELNAAFAADPMIDKARTLARELHDLGDAMKSEEILARLKAAREDALRVVRDRSEIFVDGGDLIQLGAHRFAVNTQAFDLTLLPRPPADGTSGLSFHISGTGYFEELVDETLEGFRDILDDTLVSEDATTARAEYLAATLLFDALAARKDAPSLSTLEAARLQEGALAHLVTDAARARFDEGYDRGVHDADAARILDALLMLRRQAGLLAHPPAPRALAALAWSRLAVDDRPVWLSRVRSTARLLSQFPDSTPGRTRVEALARELARVVEPVAHALDDTLPCDAATLLVAARYLVDEVTVRHDVPTFVLSAEAALIVDELGAQLDRTATRRGFDDDLAALSGHPREQLALALAWCTTLVDGAAAGSPLARARPAIPEAAVQLVSAGRIERSASGGASTHVVHDLFSQHPRIVDRSLELRLDEFLVRVRRFVDVRVPRFLACKARRVELVEQRKRTLRLAEFTPRVLSSFVRNQLINEVYLPLVGANLAKQMGAAGDKKRADLMGLLLLLSPPGYGKTTLMEYVAQRLGLFYVKVNGPSLGHGVTSLDPAEAPDATSRQEVEKLNFAFELGHNVLLLVDDIQHTSPELLQKFISLCDGTRRIEGVWRGKTRTYDLRGKRFVVCMAGNPYTESGEKFKIPDMLANRADTYNLGDILGGRKDAFALSYIENALTANPVLQPLSSRDPKDVQVFVRLARGEQVPTTELKHGYAGAEIDEIVRVLQKLLRVQAVLLDVNAAYIASAATDDRFRTEPPFKLQGSYRNMGKLADKVVSVMNDDELQRLIDDHYRQEAQTLTTGAEANLLKLAELRGRMSDEQRARWTEIKRGYARLQVQGDTNDPASRVASTLSSLTQKFDDVVQAIASASAATTTKTTIAPAPTASAPAAGAPLDALTAQVERMVQALQSAQLAVTVNAPPPKGIGDLVRLQTILIEASLLPLVKGLSSSIEHEKENAKRLEEALASLRAIEQKGAVTSSVSHETHRPFAPKPTTDR